jgi:broad specificity phosphatase PhoE
MTRFLLVRHGEHDLLSNGVIAGRQPGVHLNSLGQHQAEQLGESLALLPIDAIYCSPLERACETAAPLARKIKVEPSIAEEFNEVDMGDWTNRSLAELDKSPQWRQWNSFRSGTRAPNGETMVDVQQRVLRKLSMLRENHRLVAIFTHADVIRATLVYFLGMPIDLLLRIDVAPGSVSAISMGADFVRVDCVNLAPSGIKSFDHRHRQH